MIMDVLKIKNHDILWIWDNTFSLVIIRTYDYEIYSHNNSLIEIWHVLFVGQSMSDDHIIGRFKT